MLDERWIAVTRTDYEHEREAFRQLKDGLPDSEPYRAWSNFTFTAPSGHPYEVDALILGPAGFFLVEVKSWVGRLTMAGGSWVKSANGSVEYLDNPYHLADAKAKKLKGLLVSQANRRGVDVPFVSAAVYFSKPQLIVDLPEHQLHGLFGMPGGLGDISDLLTASPRYDDQRVTAEQAKQLAELLGEVGIRRSQRYYQVGMWRLEGVPFAVGPTWQDHLAAHREMPAERRRVRLYLVERQASQEQRGSVERAARRELAVLHGVEHPNIVRVDAMESHQSGPALVYRYDPRSRRLDQYLDAYGEKLPPLVRVRLVRQVAEALAFAHGRRLYHRALSAHSVLVIPAAKRQGLTEEQAWLDPRLEIIDWHLASRERVSSDDPIHVEATVHGGFHLSKQAGAYLAPEWRQRDADPIALDVFGAGAIAYALLAGQPPAASMADLWQRLAAENGLRPSSVRDGVSAYADELVQAATAPSPAARLTNIDEFLELVDELERELAEARRSASTEPVEIDPLEAQPGDRVGEWTVEERLGTGSTSRAFLARHVDGTQHVIKVALSQDKAPRLEHEAAVLRRLRNDSRVIRLIRPNVIDLCGRSALVFEHVSRDTLARKLRQDGRLTVDELETYGDQLFDVVAFLEGESIQHRDIKPDNIVIRTRPNRTKTPVLFDFSLASVSPHDLQAGTVGYRDPFIGIGRRTIYDDAAERYALAVTLHEMASAQLPVWGDGRTEPSFTEGPPALAVEAFEPMLREGLADFFARALCRDVESRFASLKEMRLAWADVFRRSDIKPPASAHPEVYAAPGELTDEQLAEAREEAAARAGLDTALEAAGLTPRAIAAASRVDATTVGELLQVAGKVLFNLPGVGANTRRELQQRIKSWRRRFGDPPPPGSNPPVSSAAPTRTEPGTYADELEAVGLDEIAAMLVPHATGRNQATVEATRLMLGLPDAHGQVPAAWALQPEVARIVQVTAGRVAQIMVEQRKRWRRLAPIVALREQLIDLLQQRGRVAGTEELADALLAARGSLRVDEKARRAVALAAVRAAVEIDSQYPEPALKQRRHGDRIMIALEATAGGGPDTPSAPALLDYADALGGVGDRLASEDALPSPATVLRALRSVRAPSGVAEALDERRLVQLAAAASNNTACNARLELYPRDLPAHRALRLAQAGIVPRDGLTPAEIQRKAATWFPALNPLPTERHALAKLLEQAGFRLTWFNGRFVSPALLSSSMVTDRRRRANPASGPTQWTVDSPELAGAHRAEEELAAAAPRGGFRALTVRLANAIIARSDLERRHGARPVNAARCFLTQLHRIVDARPKPTWATVEAADIAGPNSTAAVRLSELLDQAWAATTPLLRDELARGGAVLLHDGAVFARYRGMDALRTLRVDAERHRAALWLLCPMVDPTTAPRLDHTAIEVAPHEWTILNEAWINGAHREAA
ncbi:BREX system serine/threonine kinase PglW [Actinomycetes bacterium KLBMP 9797]